MKNYIIHVMSFHSLHMKPLNRDTPIGANLNIIISTTSGALWCIHTHKSSQRLHYPSPASLLHLLVFNGNHGNRQLWAIEGEKKPSASGGCGWLPLSSTPCQRLARCCSTDCLEQWNCLLALSQSGRWRLPVHTHLNVSHASCVNTSSSSQ